MTTYIGLAIAAGILLGIEAWALTNPDDDDLTITANTRAAVKRYPIIAFIAGLICGHLFWP